MKRYSTAFVVALFIGCPAILLPSTAFRLLVNALEGRRGAAIVAAGLAVGSAFWVFLSRSHAGFWRTLHHETAHAAMAAVLGGRPGSLVVADRKGSLSYSITGPLAAARSFLVTIAPYSISPLSPGIALALAIITPRGRAQLWLAAAFVGLALSAPMLEIDSRQDDLQRSGGVWASACSIWLWAATAVVFLKTLSGMHPAHAILHSYWHAAALAVRVAWAAQDLLTGP